MVERTGGVDQRLVKAIAPPAPPPGTRGAWRRVASPSEIATELHEPLGRVSHHVRRALFGQNLARILRDVRSAANGGGFEHPRAHVSYTLLELDEEGFDAVAEVLVDPVQRLLAIRTASAERTSRNGSVPVRTELAVMHFERA